MATKTIDHTELVECLGQCPKGYRYWLGADLYVYQQFPDEHWFLGEDVGGMFNGYICTERIWFNVFHVGRDYPCPA